MMVSTERIRSLSDWFNGVGALAVPGEELACEVKAALDELLACREGHDPAEREPDLGQWAVIEPFDVRDGEPPCVVAQWVSTPPEVIDGWACYREPDARVWFVDLGGFFNWWAAADVRRWYPIGRGEG